MAVFGGRRRRASVPVPSDILVVCTGNVCRSPYIAALLTAAHPSLLVRSAGTGALVGSGPSEPVVDMLTAHGLDPWAAAHAGQQVTPGLVAGAALILAATGAHRSYVVGLDAPAASRCYTLLELARLVSGLSPAGGIPGLLAAASEALSRDSMDHDDDLSDPWQLPQAVYDEMAATVAAALAVISPWLDTSASGR